MYRVFTIPTPQLPRKETWIEAVSVRESFSGRFWEFLDADGVLVSRLEKARVERFEEAEDRRKPRHLALVEAKPRDVVWSARFNEPKPLDPGA